jgi:hypothetical protein
MARLVAFNLFLGSLYTHLCVELCLLQKYVDILIPSTQDVTLFRNRIFADLIELKWGHSGGTQSNDWCPLDSNTVTHRVKTMWSDIGKMACDIIGVMLPQVMGHLGLPQGSLSLQVSEGAWVGWHLHLRLPASRTERQWVSVALSHPVCIALLCLS